MIVDAELAQQRNVGRRPSKAEDADAGPLSRDGEKGHDHIGGFRVCQGRGPVEEADVSDVPSFSGVPAGNRRCGADRSGVDGGSEAGQASPIQRVVHPLAPSFPVDEAGVGQYLHMV